MRRYLETPESRRPRRGRRRTPEGITKRLAAIDDALAGADPLDRLQLVQERMNLQAGLEASGEGSAGLEELEAVFVDVSATYGERKGLSYQAWRAVGVAPGC